MSVQKLIVYCRKESAFENDANFDLSVKKCYYYVIFYIPITIIINIYTASNC